MFTRMTLLAMFLALSIPAEAQSLSDWMIATMEETLHGKEIAPEWREMLLTEAAGHTRGYDIKDIDPCYLDIFTQHLFPQTARQAASNSNPIDYVRFMFVRQLLSTLHAESYEKISPEQIDSQIDALAAALRANVAEQFPDFVDDQLLDQLEAGWEKSMRDLANQCTITIFKAPLPDKAFEDLREAVRHAPISEDSQASALHSERQRATSGLSEEERRRNTELEGALSRYGVSAETREKVLQVGRREMSPRIMSFRLRTLGDNVIFDTVQDEWLKFANSIPDPNGETREAALHAAWERAGVGIEEQERVEALFSARAR